MEDILNNKIQQVQVAVYDARAYPEIKYGAEVNAAYKRHLIKDKEEEKGDRYEDRITQEYSFYNQLKTTKANISVLELLTLEPYRTMLL